MPIQERLRELKISLPEVTPPVAAFVPFVRTGNLVFVSGHIAKKDGKPWTGRLGAGVTTEQGQQAARAVAIDAMGTLQAAAGDLEKVRRIVKLLVLVASAPGFTEQHLVANGASELFMEVFGERGAHARSAIGIVEAPFGACVELELVAEVAWVAAPVQGG
jgi:enamine deaminase RidA (YjgF/YER057c/UK114 family)